MHQHLGAVVALFHHPLYLFQVTDGAGKPVDYGLLIFVDMTVGVGDPVGMEIGMVMVVLVVMFVVVLVVMIMFVFMGIRHGNSSLSFPCIIPYFREFCNRGVGIVGKKFFDIYLQREYNK